MVNLAHSFKIQGSDLAHFWRIEKVSEIKSCLSSTNFSNSIFGGFLTFGPAVWRHLSQFEERRMLCYSVLQSVSVGNNVHKCTSVVEFLSEYLTNFLSDSYQKVLTNWVLKCLSRKRSELAFCYLVHLVDIYKVRQQPDFFQFVRFFFITWLFRLLSFDIGIEVSLIIKYCQGFHSVENQFCQFCRWLFPLSTYNSFVMSVNSFWIFGLKHYLNTNLCPAYLIQSRFFFNPLFFDFIWFGL